MVLVGGGPGDPELVTMAARRALSEADVVVTDRLAPRELLDELSPDVELIDVTKLPRGRAAAQEEINRVIVDRALAGHRVVRFKGGDSFVYGRGFEEALACEAAGVPWTVIPGLTSAISVPAVAGIPVTHRGVAHEFTVISGHLPPDHPDSLVEWDAVARLKGTVVLLMAVQNLPLIAERLVKGGRPRDDPARDHLRGHDAGGADPARARSARCTRTWRARRCGRPRSWWSAASSRWRTPTATEPSRRDRTSGQAESARPHVWDGRVGANARLVTAAHQFSSKRSSTCRTTTVWN